MPDRVEDHIETVRVRRAPKFSVFLVVGAGLGILVALILTFAFDGSDAVSPNTGVVYSSGQVFGFLTLVCVTVGVALAAIVALIFDRSSSRHIREVTVDHESVHVEPAPGTEEARNDFDEPDARA
ncbi:potassium transporter Trk [Microbacterium sp. 2FI]|uniref:potassium transporter Trk n=1 Tax=Microbacterium sp. 2FI TaxID=2502193 RepID=UPI0010F8FBC8|nr:potassium transporter Trk [Microbacterium sp. 2FI]